MHRGWTVKRITKILFIHSFIHFLIKVWKQFFEMLIFYNGVALAVLMNSKLTITFFKIQNLI